MIVVHIYLQLYSFSNSVTDKHARECAFNQTVHLISQNTYQSVTTTPVLTSRFSWAWHRCIIKVLSRYTRVSVG